MGLWAKLKARLTRPKMGASYWRGAQISNQTADWFPQNVAADREIKADGWLLRARARQLIRDNPHVAGLIRTFQDNVIGTTEDGIALQCRNMLGDQPLTDLNNQIEAAWCHWGRPETASASGQQSWADLQRLYVALLVGEGEVLYRFLPGFPNAYGFAIEFLDNDQLNHTRNRPRTEGQNEIRSGVEIDRWGRPVAYWLWDRHPTDPGRREERVPADQVCHDFRMDRPGQTRGVPWLAPGMFTLRMMDGYTEAEVMAARQQANNGGFLTAKGEDANLWSALMPQPTPGEAMAPLVMDSEPGQHVQLPPGLSVENTEPTHPNTAFPQFEEAILMRWARSMGVSFFSATGNFKNTNYSSGRMALEPERDTFRQVAGFVTTRLHERCFGLWLNQAALTGMVQLPSFDVDAYREHVWQYRGWGGVDVMAEAQRDILEVNMGVNSLTRIAAAKGRNFADIMAERREEIRLAEEMGVPIGLEAYPIEPGGGPPTDQADTGAETDQPSKQNSPNRQALRVLGGTA